MTTQFSKGAIIPDGFFAQSRRGAVQDFVAGYEDIYLETPGFIDAVSYDTATILLNTVARPATWLSGSLSTNAGDDWWAVRPMAPHCGIIANRTHEPLRSPASGMFAPVKACRVVCHWFPSARSS